jgi:hypothetical protein
MHSLTVLAVQQSAKRAPRLVSTSTQSQPLRSVLLPTKKVRPTIAVSNERQLQHARSCVFTQDDTVFSPVIAAEQLPSAKTLSTGSKRFFFDIFSNERGVCVMPVPSFTTFDLNNCSFSYLRVSELGASNQVSASSFYTHTRVVSHADARLFLQRNSIAIPQEAWPSVAEIIQGYSQQMPQ